MAQLWVIDAVGDVEHANRQGELLRSGLFTDHILVTAPTSGAIHKAYGISNEVSSYSQGSRPSAQVPEICIQC